MLATAGVACLVYSESSARRARSFTFGRKRGMSSGRHLLAVTAWNLYLGSHAHRPFSLLVFTGFSPSKYHFRIHATGAEQFVRGNASELVGLFMVVIGVPLL